MDNATYVYDYANDRYASFVGGQGTNGGSNKIASMQGFFVHVDQTLSFELTNDVRVVGDNSNYMKSNGPEDEYLLKLLVTGEGHSDEMAVRFTADASNNFDPNLDAYKLLGAQNNLNLYTSIGAEKISINSLPLPTSSKTIPLTLETKNSGDYTFILNHKDEIDTNITVFLEDTWNDSLHDININPIYTFHFDVSENPNRFNLLFKHSSDEDLEEEDSEFSAYYLNNQFILKGITAPSALNIYSISGQLMTETQLVGNSTESIFAGSFPIGCYVLRLSNPSGVKIAKVMLHKYN
jgi:hypothetical protein